MKLLIQQTATGAWEARSLFSDHGSPNRCGICHADISRVAITELVYAFASCECDKVDYPHLIEVPYHLREFAGLDRTEDTK